MPTVFVDVDGTLIAGESQMHFLRHLYRTSFLGFGDMALLFAGLVLYKLGLLGIGSSLRRHSIRLLRGQSSEPFESETGSFVRKTLVPLLRPSILRELNSHRGAGRRIVLVSAAIEPIVRCLANHLEVRDIIATKLAVEFGRYTGAIEGLPPWGDQKVNQVLVFAERHNIILEDCFAYSDHCTDIGLLTLVGNPFVVNPDRRLRRQARKAGWPIL